MRCSQIIFGVVTWLAIIAPVPLCAQIQKPADSSPVQGSANPSPGATSPLPPPSSSVSSSGPAAAAKDHQIDGVAARIEDDIITESEVRELAAFQNLVDGKAKSRDELLRELADQWLIRSEAVETKYAKPAAADVDRAYAEFIKQFGPRDEFLTRLSAVGLSEAAVRRMVEQQLYLSRFIDYRFRPSAQVSDKEVEDYYQNEFSPQLKKHDEPIPPLDDVEDTIREVLIQRAINERANKWLNDTRPSLKIDVMSPGSGS
jgi:hypothetical protein